MSLKERPNGPSEARGTILVGGLALVGGAFAFLGVFSYLAVRFRYPEVLDGTARDVLPALLATGAAGRTAWALYSVLPLVFIPAGVGAFEALRERAAGPMRVGMLFALLAAASMMLGLMRWPSAHWELARAWGAAAEGDRLVLAAVFDGLNRYLGNFVGEFLGEFSFSVFFVLSGVGLLRHRRAPRWVGWWGVATGVLGLIGMWRNVTPVVDAVGAANNYLLPAWMIGFGVWLVITSRNGVTPVHIDGDTRGQRLLSRRPKARVQQAFPSNASSILSVTGTEDGRRCGARHIELPGRDGRVPLPNSGSALRHLASCYSLSIGEERRPICDRTSSRHALAASQESPRNTPGLRDAHGRPGVKLPSPCRAISPICTLI